MAHAYALDCGTICKITLWRYIATYLVGRRTPVPFSNVETEVSQWLSLVRYS